MKAFYKTLIETMQETDYPLDYSLSVLIGAAEKLLKNNGYDGHDREEISNVIKNLKQHKEFADKICIDCGIDQGTHETPLGWMCHPCCDHFCSDEPKIPDSTFRFDGDGRFGPAG